MILRQKKFKHNLVKTPLKLQQINGEEGGRYYLAEGHNERLYSITTVLSKTMKSDKLEKWKEAVGAERAKKIVEAASARGSALHKYCEVYLSNQEVDADVLDRNFEIFKRVKRILDKDVDDILGIESAFYSLKYGIAGTADIIAGYKGVPAIIDVKSVKNSLKVIPEKTDKYFLQCTGYSLMIEECTGLKIRKAVLLFGTEEYEPPVVREHDITDEDIEKLKSVIAEFRAQTAPND